MVDKKTSDETVASALDGTELVRIVQGGTTKRTTTANVAPPLPFFGIKTLNGWSRPAAASFSTWINQTPSGLLTATLTDNPDTLPLIVEAAIDSNFYTLSAVLKSRGAAPWTLTAAVAGIANACGAGVWFHPLVLRNSGTDRAVSLQWTGGTGNSDFSGGGLAAQTQIIRWADVSTGAAATRTVPGSGNTNTAFGFSFSDYFAWFRVSSDGTTLTFSISQEGVLFLPLGYSETLADFLVTVDQVGFGVERLNNNNPATGLLSACALWNWLES